MLRKAALCALSILLVCAVGFIALLAWLGHKLTAEPEDEAD